MDAWQFGQWDEWWIIDSFFGNLKITTLKNEPKIAPKIKIVMR